MPGKNMSSFYGFCERFKALIAACVLTWIELLDNKFNLSNHLFISFLDKAAQNFFHSLIVAENIVRSVFHVTTVIEIY